MTNLGFILMVLLVALLIGVILFLIIRTVWQNFNRKNFVDVDIYNINNTGTVERDSYDCLMKAVMQSNERIYNLSPLFSRLEFPYIQEYVYTRTRDRKRVISFINIRGHLIPFVPSYNLEEVQDKKKIKDKNGKEREVWVVNKRKIEITVDYKGYTTEMAQQRIENKLRRKLEKYQNWATDGGFKFKWQLIVAGILILGMIGYLIYRYAG
jgi:uncharacterized membrane protein YraQ (UPF0718 family)